MKRYAPPALQTSRMGGYVRFVAQISLHDSVGIEAATTVLCDRIKAWVEEGAIAERVEFVPDLELSFSAATGEEIDGVETRNAAKPDILNYHDIVDLDIRSMWED